MCADSAGLTLNAKSNSTGEYVFKSRRPSLHGLSLIYSPRQCLKKTY